MIFADETKLSGEVDTSERRATPQEYLDKLEEWANKNLMKLKTNVRSCTCENVIQECTTG